MWVAYLWAGLPWGVLFSGMHRLSVSRPSGRPSVRGASDGHAPPEARGRTMGTGVAPRPSPSPSPSVRLNPAHCLGDTFWQLWHTKHLMQPQPFEAITLSEVVLVGNKALQVGPGPRLGQRGVRWRRTIECPGVWRWRGVCGYRGGWVLGARGCSSSPARLGRTVATWGDLGYRVPGVAGRVCSARGTAGPRVRLRLSSCGCVDPPPGSAGSSPDPLRTPRR